MPKTMTPSPVGEYVEIFDSDTALKGRVPTTVEIDPKTGAPFADGLRPVLAQNIAGKFREAFESYDPVAGGKWLETKAADDLVFVDGNAAAASYLVISKSPLSANTETSIELASALHFSMPAEISMGLAMSQRTLGQELAVEVVDTGTPLPDIPDIAIASISQATTTLTIDTVAPHGLSVGKSFGVSGCSNQLANYPSLVVASTPSPTQITATAGPGGTITSQTISNPAGAKGAIYFRQRMGRAQNGVSQIFENNSVTNSSIYVRSEAGDALPSGTIQGSHVVTVGSTAPVQLVNSPYCYAFGATTEYRVVLQSDRVQWTDAGVDTSSQANSRLVRSQVCPDPADVYKLRFRFTNNKAMTVPVGQVVSAAKTGTTTAIIIMDRPHGLVATDPVVVYGIRAQGAAEFPNLLTATAVASVIDPTTFTVVIGTAGTITSYGGYVAKVLGGNLMSALGANAVVAQSAVLSTLADGTRQLVLTGNTTWAGLTIGDMAEAVGVRDIVSGASLGLDGPWKVANVVTTALTLVLPFAGQRALPADFALTNCGGGIIKRTCARISFVRVYDYARLRVEALARPANDAAGGMPVNVQNTVPTTLASTNVGGNTAVDAAMPNPVATGGRASNANIVAMSATGDLVAQLMTMIGASVNKPYSIPEADWQFTGTLTNVTSTAMQAAGGAGIKKYLTGLTYQNTNGTATVVNVLRGTTVIFTFSAAASMVNPVPIPLPTPLQTAANEALNIQCVTTGANVLVNAQGYTAP